MGLPESAMSSCGYVMLPHDTGSTLSELHRLKDKGSTKCCKLIFCIESFINDWIDFHIMVTENKKADA